MSARALALIALALGCDDSAQTLVDAGLPVDAAADAADLSVPDADRPDLEPGWPWPDRGAPNVDSDFARAHPRAFARMSRWTTEFSADDAPVRHARGAFGVGNGRVFALLGLADPLNTLHGMVGPSYSKGRRFFGDYAIELEGATPGRDQVARSVSAAVAFSELELLGGARLRVHDFAPAADDAAGHCLVRVVEVRGVSGTGTLWVRPARAVEVTGAAVRESVDDRHLVTAVEPGGVPGVDGIRVALSGDWSGVVTHCFGRGAAPPVPRVDVGRAIEALVDAAEARAAERARVDLPDAQVADLLDGWLQSIDVQTATTGAVSPLSRYTRFWTRDTIGPLLAFLAAGDHAAAARLLDYLYAANVQAGAIRNSYGADLEFDPQAPEPDWAARPALSGRVAAESPSYPILMHAAVLRATGDTAPIRARWPWLTRNLLAQGFDAGRLPFSGDETFRLALNVALGLSFEHPHERTSWSANSAILWLAGAREFVGMATALALPGAVEAEARSAEVSAATEAHFALGDGCYGALMDRETEAVEAPFEDVQLKVIWAGWRSGDSPEGQAAVRCAIEHLGTAPGVVQSPLAPRYRGFPLLPVGDGVRTGMLPGYTLSALTRVGHPAAFDAFAALANAVPTSGSVAEYHGAPGGEAITLVYDPTGQNGDSGARFRPWEAGIVYAAALEYLFGFAPDALAARLVLRPHLPPGWPRMALRGARVGEWRVDVEVVRDGPAIVTEVSGAGRGTLTVDLRADGARVIEPPGRQRVWTAFGQTSVEAGGLELRSGQPLRLRATP